LSQEKLAFNVAKGINDIKSQALFETSVIKPSVACKSNPESIATFFRLLECLHLTCGCDFEGIIEVPKRLILRMRFQSSLTSGLKEMIPRRPNMKL